MRNKVFEIGVGNHYRIYKIFEFKLFGLVFSFEIKKIIKAHIIKSIDL